FGWIVGVREQFHRDLHVHARHAIGERAPVRQETEEIETEEVEGEQQEQQQEAREREVAAQMLYHRPTRSGVYAFVTLFQAWRIGLNEVNYTYVLRDSEGEATAEPKENVGTPEACPPSKDSRKKRYELVLTAYEWTFKRPDGAMTTTRLPHIEGIEGLVLVAEDAVPVPLL
ncbi:MAG: hypothetical protein RMK94_17570, partial [Armatimonadota bacterium]|nr:hypothetical protein [Armatimonadota bacterium]